MARNSPFFYFSALARATFAANALLLNSLPRVPRTVPLMLPSDADAHANKVTALKSGMGRPPGERTALPEQLREPSRNIGLSLRGANASRASSIS